MAENLHNQQLFQLEDVDLDPAIGPVSVENNLVAVRREHGSNLFDSGDGLSKLDEVTIYQVYQVDIEVVEGVAAAVGGMCQWK